MAGLVLLSFMTANLQALLWQSSQWLVSAILPAVVVELTNTERGAEATAPLRRNPILDEAAQRKAEHMVSEGYFSHFSPEGVSPWHWFDEVGYVYAYAGENLAVHFTDTSAVVDAWMNSPTHRANIVNGNYTEIGVGTARGVFEGFDTVFVVQLFGTPAYPAPYASARIDAPTLPEELASASMPITPSGTAAVVLAETTVAATSSAASSTLVTATASATAVAFAYETTPRSDSAPATAEETSLTHEVADDSVTFALGTMSTTSGLTPRVDALPGYTASEPVPTYAKLATQPSLFLTVVYSLLASVIAAMLLLSLTLAIRSGRSWQIVHTLVLCGLLGGLLTLHLYLTTGAVVV